VKVGDRVAGIFFQDWQAGEISKSIMKSALGGEIDGMLSEYVVLTYAAHFILKSTKIQMRAKTKN
jgi:hypothetical protein